MWQVAVMVFSLLLNLTLSGSLMWHFFTAPEIQFTPLIEIFLFKCNLIPIFLWNSKLFLAPTISNPLFPFALGRSQKKPFWKNDRPEADGKLRSVELLVFHVDMFTRWHVDMLTCWHVDMLTCWQTDKLTSWQADMMTADMMTSWHDDKLTWWQADMITSWQNPTQDDMI